ncbi:MAG: gliding motility-associated-like protein [Flavobacteriales bacterium]|jgi:gliding motility-associated-like protein
MCAQLAISGACYGQSFNEDWTMPLITSDSCRVNDMVIDELNAEVYIVGSFTGDMSSVFPTGVNGTFDFSSNYGGRDGFVAKYNLSGSFIWAFYVGGSEDDEVKAIDVSSAGNFYIIGNFETAGNFNGVIGAPASINGSFGSLDIFQAAYSSAGLLSWVHEDGGTSDDDAIDVKYIEGFNRVVFAGNYYNQGQFGGLTIGVPNNSFHTFVLGRYDNGLTHWVNAPNGSGDERSVRLEVKNNDVYLVGEFIQDFSIGAFNIPFTNSDDKVFCLKMDAYGNLDWLSSFSATGSLNVEDVNIESASNRILFTGSYTGVIQKNSGIISPPSYGEDCYLLAINENNAILSGIKTFHSDQPFGKVVGKSISQVANNGAIILGCDFTNSFQPETGVTVTSSSQIDGVIMLLNNVGNHRANQLITSSDDVEISNVFIDQNQDLFHSENWSQSLQIETSNFSAVNANNGALGKLNISVPCYFDYSPNSFCTDTGIVILDTVSMPFGSFYNLDGNISIDTSTGSLDISNSNSTIGSYVYHQNIGCVDSVLITVIDRFNPSLVVASYEYCQEDLNIDLTSFIAGDNGGVWSGLNVNGSDLIISSTQTGVFTFQYESPANYFCPSIAIDSVNVSPVFDPGWIGLTGDYCVNDPDIVLSTLITGDSGGIFLIGTNIEDTLVFADLPIGGNTIRYLGVIGNCAEDSITVFKIISGEVNAGVDDSICGLSNPLNGISSENSTVWIALDSGVNISNDQVLNTTVVADSSGVYNFELFSQNGVCSFRDTVLINFLEIPIVDAGIDQVVAVSEVELSGSGSANVVLWSAWNMAIIDQPEVYITEVTNLEIGDNEFIITGENQFCTALPDSVVITYQDIVIPNAFSPNGDGYNDTFELIGLETFEHIKLTILTKWGEVLLTTEDYQNDWNGLINNNPLADGVYFYLIDYDDNQTQGFIEIKR